MDKRVLIGRQTILDYLDIDKNTFYDLVADGMPATHRGVKRKTWVLNLDELEAWSMSGSSAATGSPEAPAGDPPVNTPSPPMGPIRA